MLYRIAACASVIVVLSALPAVADAANVVRPSSVTAAVALASGEARGVHLQCPDPAVAVNGAASRRDAGLTLRRSTPGTGAGDWHFRLTADADGRTHRGTLVLRCVRLALPTAAFGARLDVKTRKRPAISLGSNRSVAVRVACGPAWLATGYGIHAGSAGIRVTSVVPLAHGWDFTVKNTDARATRVGLSARCLKERVTSTLGVLRFRTTRPSRQNELGPARVHSLTQSCGSGLFSLATGSTLEPAATFELDASGPVRSTRGRWTFRRGSGRVRTHLVCLSQTSRFR
jgi:hypothetical protein